MSNSIYNPGEGVVCYDTAGVGSSGSPFSSHKVLGGAVMGSKNQTNMDGVALGIRNPLIDTKAKRGFHQGVGTLFVTGSLAATCQASGSYCSFKLNGLNGLVAGLKLNVGQSGAGSTAIAGGPQMTVNGLYGSHTILGVSATGFSTNLPFQSTYAGIGVTVKVADSRRNFNTMTAGKYVGQKFTTELAGVGTAVLKYGSNAGMLTRSIHKAESIRTTKTANALRAAYYNRLTGKWTVAPTISSTTEAYNSAGTATGLADDDAAKPSAATPGELVYKSGRPLPWGGGVGVYKARTTW